MDAADGFAQTYAHAREKFLAAAQARGLEVGSCPHPLPGRDGETVALDVVADGPDDAEAVLLVSSGCHGVEGFGGSGAQVALLRDEAVCAAARAADITLLYIHALNPWGFSWWRRTTHENVDLNRNGHDFSQPLPRNDGYEELAELLLPAAWPPTTFNEARLLGYAVRHGRAGLQAAVSGGQFEHPEGLFYGGRGPTWSRLTFEAVLRKHAARCTRIGWIDLHTGLGPAGHGERIHAGDDDALDAVSLARARRWWGAEVTSVAEGGSVSSRLSGMIGAVFADCCPQAEMTGIALEFGTVPLPAMFDALRADQWVQNHPETPAAQRHAVKQRMRDAFYLDTDAWKHAVVEQTTDAAVRAIAGLAAAAPGPPAAAP